MTDNDTKKADAATTTGGHPITLRALLLGALFSALFAYFTVLRENIPPGITTTATQIAVFPFLFLAAVVVIINPLIKHVLRFIRPFAPAEILIIFIMTTVSSGISTFGLASQLIPAMSSLMNPAWNTDASRWDIYVEPHVNDAFFVAANGTRQAAETFEEHYSNLQQARSAFHAAKAIRAARQLVNEAEQRLKKAQAVQDETKRAIQVQSAKNQLHFAQYSFTQTEKLWAPYRDKYDPDRVVETFPAEIEQLEAQTEAAKAELEEFETTAFDEVKQFREGLPKELRAIPAIIYRSGESITAYRARLKRYSKGMDARQRVSDAIGLLSAAEVNNDAAKQAAGLLEEAVKILEPVSGIPELAKRKESLNNKLTVLREERAQTNRVLRELREQRRLAPVEDFEQIDKQIKETRTTTEQLAKRITNLETRLDEQINPPLEVAARVDTTITDLKGIEERLRQPAPAYEEIRNELQAEIEDFRTFDASTRRLFFGDINWGMWLRPLILWSLIACVTYMVLMTFNVLIFRQWAYNERLIYPLAELPMLLTGEDGGASGKPPAVYRSALFWVGAGISILVLGWNNIAKTQTLFGLNLSGLGAINLTFELSEYVTGTFLQGLAPHAKLHVFFTLIGLAFLVPANISKSLWLFHMVFWGVLLALVGMGLGVNQNSFTADWWTTLNFRNAIGGGALFVFACVVLWKCRTYLFCMFRPKALEKLPKDEQTELRISSWLFVGGSVALIGMLTWGLGANLFFAIFCYFVILVITIGLVRVVTEGGILTFQCWFGPFHVIRNLFGMNHAWTAPPLFAPLVVFYSILFLDVKTFIAPAMANSIKIRDSLRMGRLRFHIGITVAILGALVVALLTHVILGYDRGGNHMHGWFYGGFPKQIFDTIKTMSVTNPVDVSGARWWLLTGAAVMGVLIYFRQRVFWLPHPIGLIMWVNPIMRTYWFSIFLGWVFKSMITKYGNKDSYAKARIFFLGLMLGEILMCLIGVGISLNRN